MNRLLVIFVASFFVACSTLHIKPDEHELEAVPAEFELYGERQEFADKWWETYKSQELARLIEEALSQNLSIKQAASRLKQAQAISIQAGSSGRLNSTVDALASTGKQGINNKSFNTEAYSLGIGGSYELDLWGKIDNRVKAAELNEEATAEDLYTVRMTIAAEVALRWLELVEVRKNIELLNRQLEVNKKIGELVTLRFRRSQATALDVFQQRDITAQSESLLPPEKARQQTTLHALAILLGKAPGADLDIRVEKLPKITALPTVGVPADLLANRPDIRSAGLRLRSAEWTIAAAKADRLPSISLTGAARYNTTEIDTIFDNWFANLMGSIAMPVIDGGYRKAEVERTNAIAKERLYSYRETVLKALKEVQDSIILEKNQDDYIAALENRLAISRQTKQEATARYRKGLVTYLPVLTVLLNEQRLERTIITAKMKKVQFRVQLHRALGGNWMKNEEKQK